MVGLAGQLRLSDNAVFLSFHANSGRCGLESMSTVGAGFVAGLLEAMSRAGISRPVLLGRAGLAPSVLDEPDARLAVADVIALFDAAVALSGRDDIGLEFARHVRPGTFHVLGYALMTCKTLGEAIALVPHYRRLVFDIGYSEMRVSRHVQDVWLGWHVLQGAHAYSATLAEALIASWYVFGRWIAGVDLPLKEVMFTHRAPAQAAAYEQFFECPVRFQATQNALVFSRELLDMPLVQADETLHLAMREQARAAMEKVFNERDIATRLRQALMPLMPKCEATLQHCARSLAVSSRTLQRHLSEAGLGFHEVLDAARKDLAKVYLRDPGLSVLDVALLLGYAEQSSFTRAFKAWFDCSPLQWRQARQALRMQTDPRQVRRRQANGRR
ncbi:MAG: AraC family transcriptional regulator [Rhodoferax sp.]|nr:AraC family transcriptional regulator [Rhodoferax sp.]